MGKEEIVKQNEEIQVMNVDDLPLANDYKGIGGPQTVPLFTPDAFHRPEVPHHSHCLLDDLFLAPSSKQLRNYQIIVTKNEITFMPEMVNVGQDLIVSGEEKESINDNICLMKHRLSQCFIFHFVLAIIMIMKLSPQILDAMNIFVIEIEELDLPKPHPWEWIWLLSSPIMFLGWISSKKSNVSLMNKTVIFLFSLGIVPILFAMSTFASDIYQLASNEDENEDPIELEEWQGLPVAVVWYSFLLIALQVHFFEVYFSTLLIRGLKSIQK